MPSFKTPRVLIVHIPYEHRGGEDVHVESLAEAYRRIGLDPILYPQNRVFSSATMEDAAWSLIPSARVPGDFLKLWKKERPDFIHLHNAFPSLGPAFFRWIIRERVPLAMTIHNHRFFCANGLALRNGTVCKACFDSKVLWRAMAYNCNGNFKKSAYHATALTEMRGAELYQRAVKRFIAPAPYMKSELLRYGIAPERIVQIFNPIESKKAEASVIKYDAIFAGRLSQEKGIRPLIEIFQNYLPELKLAIVGDGAERSWVQSQARGGITYLGPVSRYEVLRLIVQSRIGILPSICNETLPTFLLECFLQGRRCVIADQESVRAFAGPGFFGAVASLDHPDLFARTIRDALRLPLPSEAEVSHLHDRFGIDAFCGALRNLVTELIE